MGWKKKGLLKGELLREKKVLSRKKRVELIFFFYLLAIILILPQAWGISVTPPKFEIDYEPGSYEEFRCQAWDVEKLEVSFGGGLAEYGQVVDVSKGMDGIYSVRFGLGIPGPEELGPGEHSLLVIFKEAPVPRLYGQTGVGAVAAINVPVKFFIPYPKKYLKLEGFEWDQELAKGELMFFKAKLKSMGEKLIEEVTGRAKIFGQGEVYWALFTSAKNVESGEAVELRGEWKAPEELGLGKYRIKGEINYDGAELETPEYYFSYGDKVIEIVSLSPLEIPAGEISKMELKVKSFWNEELNFFAKVRAYDINNSPVGETASAQTVVGRNGEGKVEFYVDASQWEEGVYKLDTDLEYEEGFSSKSFMVKAVSLALPEETEEPEGKDRVLLGMVAGGFLGAVILVVLGYGIGRYFQRKKRKQKEKEDGRW